MRLFIKTALVLWACLLTGWLAFGQTTSNVAHLSVERFSVEQGLADRNINCLTKDKQGFLWVGTYNGLSRFDGYSFLNFDSRPGNPNSVHSNKIERIVVDRSGNLLVGYGAPTHWVFDVLNPLTRERTPLIIQNTTDKYLYCFKAADGSVYFFFPDDKKGKLYRFDEKTGRADKQFEFPFQPFTNNNSVTALQASDGTFWFTQSQFLVHTDAQGTIIHTFSTRQIAGGKIDHVIESLVQTTDGNLWIGMQEAGVFFWEKGSFKPFGTLPRAAFLLAADRVGNLLAYQNEPNNPLQQCFLVTSDGRVSDYSAMYKHQSVVDQVYADDFRVWFVAGNSMGFNKFQVRPERFKTYLSKDLGNAPYGISSRGICKVGPHTIYIVTEYEGLFEVDTRTGKTVRTGDQAPQLRLLNHLILGRNMLNQGDSVLWICGGEGVVRYHPGKKVCRYFKPIVNEAWGIVFGKKDLLWMLMRHEGLTSLNTKTGVFTPYRNHDGSNPLLGDLPNCILTGKDGALWIGSSLYGLMRIDPEKHESRMYSAHPGDPAGFLSNQVACMYETQNGLFWVGTLNAGLHLFDPISGKVLAVYTQEDGLCNSSVVGILPDGRGNFWISTLNGLSFFNPKEKTFHNYSTADGLSHNEFNRHSYHLDPVEKRFYFGGMNGVNAFVEADLKQEAYHAPLLVSELSHQTRGDRPVVINTGIGNGTTVTLEPGNTFLQLRLALVDYAFPPGNQFAYNLEGLDGQWNNLGANRDLRINYLPAGNYTLRLRGADSRGNWSSEELSIKIVVKQFWYLQWWARMFYAVFFATAGFYFYRFEFKRRIAEKETHRLHELDVFKSRLFTNISHEFRTPLTVILGTTDHLIRENQQKIQHSTSSFSMVRRNGERLLLLVNQILDLAKLESNTLKLDNIQADVLPYIRYIVESLNSLAGSQNVKLLFESPEKAMVMDYDPERLLQIVNNLLTNAIKYTPAGGNVALQVSMVQDEGAKTTQCRLVITDNGAGIPAGDLPFIFDRFYQANNLEKANTGGTGIGLALTKELVQLMGGQINVESEEGKGSRFVVTLPITRSAPTRLATLDPVKKVEDVSARVDQKSQEELPALLLIEDNPDVVEYLISCLQESYRIDVAFNGDAGISKALETVPDLIVSDVMMPGKDGFEVCDVLKNDVRTSHIPLVLLTARADVESRLAGLRRGADAYLAKPFLRAELLVTLENLLTLRRNVQLKFAEWYVASNGNAGEKQDDSPELIQEHTFVQQVRKVVEDNMANASFTVEKLCQLLAMSQPQLHRKLTALTGKNATQFIRSIRLARAKVLLEQKEKTVSEVAYEVGFDDPKYFSRVFSETFGIPPSKV
ncbi:MAG: helix-turn-helix domain-containing protein [Saprospiraceae bacterium]|nr:helix-turn-helix domain-containing protein [Saprospiraceae bacterium]